MEQALLKIVADRKKISTKDLAAELNVSKDQVSALCKKLVKAGQLAFDSVKTGAVTVNIWKPKSLTNVKVTLTVDEIPENQFKAAFTKANVEVVARALNGGISGARAFVVPIHKRQKVLGIGRGLRMKRPQIEKLIEEVGTGEKVQKWMTSLVA